MKLMERLQPKPMVYQPWEVVPMRLVFALLLFPMARLSEPSTEPSHSPGAGSVSNTGKLN